MPQGMWVRVPHSTPKKEENNMPRKRTLEEIFDIMFDDDDIVGQTGHSYDPDDYEDWDDDFEDPDDLYEFDDL